jgi:hypothetical protein
MRNAYKILIAEPERKRPLGKCRWEYNIKNILRKQHLSAWTGFMWLRMWTSGGLL